MQGAVGSTGQLRGHAFVFCAAVCYVVCSITWYSRSVVCSVTLYLLTITATCTTGKRDLHLHRKETYICIEKRHTREPYHYRRSPHTCNMHFFFFLSKVYAVGFERGTARARTAAPPCYHAVIGSQARERFFCFFDSFFARSCESLFS
jgi:hypothetical protein